jgi:hypothetical protein
MGSIGDSLRVGPNLVNTALALRPHDRPAQHLLLAVAEDAVATTIGKFSLWSTLALIAIVAIAIGIVLTR